MRTGSGSSDSVDGDGEPAIVFGQHLSGADRTAVVEALPRADGVRVRVIDDIGSLPT